MNWRFIGVPNLQNRFKVMIIRESFTIQSEKRKGSSGCINTRTCDMIQLKYNYMKCATKN